MQISDEVIKILEYLCEKLGVTIDWTSNNVLPYINQLCEKFIIWETSTSFAWIALVWGVVVIALVVLIFGYKYIDLAGIEWLTFGLIFIIAIVVTGFQVFDIIECKTFPEKAIYDYINYIINTNR